MLFDYFVSKDKTAVGVLKLLSEQVLLQANRISDLLFNGNLNGNSLIATAIKVRLSRNVTINFMHQKFKELFSFLF